MLAWRKPLGLLLQRVNNDEIHTSSLGLNMIVDRQRKLLYCFDFWQPLQDVITVHSDWMQGLEQGRRQKMISGKGEGADMASESLVFVRSRLGFLKPGLYVKTQVSGEKAKKTDFLNLFN